MNPHEIAFLHILHVLSVLVLTGYTFLAFAAAPETRKRVLMVTGTAALLVLLTGLRLWQVKYGWAMMGWISVKFLCWLGLAALSGIGYRRRESAGTLMLVAVVLLALAVTMVYAFGGAS
jgi:hypothetical protein